MTQFPNVKSHLDRFKEIITSENKPYGLNRARDEKFFKGERLIVQRKCPQKPSFVYVPFDAYFNRTFIPIKTSRINLKYLSGIFNSKVSSFWLKNKGKMQGDNFQVDKDPVLSIPIHLCKSASTTLINLVSITIKVENKVFFEEIIDAVIFNLYFPEHMEERGIDVLKFVEKDINDVMKDRFFEKLEDFEKEKVIEQLHAKWSHPDNEVHNRIKQFAIKSPEILKPILES